jgi:hypothetical protein
MSYDDLITKGATSHDDAQIIEVMLRDSTTGMGKTALTYSGVTAYFCRQGDAAATAITLCTMTAGTYTNQGAAGTGGGFVNLDNTNMPGVYQLCLPDAALATGANSVTVHIKGSGVIDAKFRILLIDANLRDAQRMGMTGLPTTGTLLVKPAVTLAPADCGGALPADMTTIHGTGLTETAGQLAGAFVKFFDHAAPTGTILSIPDAAAGAASGLAIVGSIMGKSPATLAPADVSGNLPTDLQTIKTQAVTCAAPLTVLASVGTAATSTAQTGDSFAVVKSGGTGDTGAIKTKTDYLPSATAGAAGGLFIAGTNAATTFATLTITSGNLPADVKAYTVQPTVSGVTLAADQAVNVTKWGGTAIASAYVQANAAQIGGQAATAGGAITVGAYVGNATHALIVDGSGNVAANNMVSLTGIATATNVTDAVTTIESHGDANWVGGGEGGTGANVVTVTVTDGTDPLESAAVRFTKGATSNLVFTNASGVAVFGLDSGTWTISASLSGYQYTPTTLAVSGAATPTITMTEVVVVPPADPNLAIGTILTEDGKGGLAPNATIQFKWISGVVADGESLTTNWFTLASDENAVLTATLRINSIYHAQRSGGPVIVVDTGSTGTFTIPKILGTG